METLYKLFSGAAAGAAACFAPISPLVICVTLFIGVDFLTGVAADRKVALRHGRHWYFESRRAWRTVLKTGFVWIAIAMASLLENCVLSLPELRLSRLFAGFVCGVELWSFLENAAELSRAPLFRWLRRYVRRHIAEEVKR